MAGMQLSMVRLPPGSVIANVEASGVALEYCSTAFPPDLGDRCRFTNVKLSRVRVKRCELHTALLEDVVVDGLRNDTESAFVNGCEFHRVTIRGRVGQLIFNPRMGDGAVSDAYAAHLGRVDEVADDWGLDISEAEGPIEIRGYAARRIVRDPARQAVVTYDQALAQAWKGVDLGGTFFDYRLEKLIHHAWPDTILVADPTDKRRFPAQLEAIARLRDLGAAQPD